MRTFPEVDADARSKRPFSNGTSGEMWMGDWCDRCVHDKAVREPDGRADLSGILGCPLVAVALLGKTPVEWFEQPEPQDYHCVEFRDQDGPDDDEPQPIPDPPDMDALLPREPYTGPLMFTANVARMARVDR